MNERYFKFILGIALLTGFFALPALAQVVPTTVWVPNFASNTITPRPSSLQIPCANIAGGCGGGGVSTSTTNTFTVPQNFTGISNAGNLTSTSFVATSSNSSYITTLNGNVALPTQAWLTTYGCPGFPSDSTIDTCANDWYGFYNGIVSSTYFTVPVNPGNYTWSDNHGFLFNNAGETATIKCVAGRGTNFKSTAATGTMAVLAWGTGSNPDAGIQDCSFIGTVTNQTSSITGGLSGIYFGSSTLANGLTGAVIHGVLLSGLSAAENFGNNAYNVTTEDSWIQNSGYNVYDPSQSNGGESNRWTNDFIVSGANSTTTDCIYVAATSAEFDNVSHDACQLDVIGGHTVVKGGHTETTQTGTYGAYIPTRVRSGATLDEFGMTYVQDGVGANLGAAFVQNDAGSMLHEYGAFLSAGASTTPAFYTGAGSEIISGTTNNGGVTPGAPLDTVPTTLSSAFVEPWINGGTNASDTLDSAQASNTEAAYATTYTIPANFLTQNKTLRVTVGFQDVVPANLTNKTVKLELRQSGVATTTIFATASTSGACAVSQTCQYGATFLISANTAPATNASVTVACASCNGGSPSTVLFGRGVTMQPVTVNTTANEILQFTTNWVNNGNPTTSSLITFLVEDIN